MSRPLILISNDDGYRAKGINEIAEVAARYGDVIVVAPDGPRSAQSSALTIEVPVHVKLIERDDDMIWYAVSGTPADCVKLALSQLLPRKPQLLISGINHGSNASINVIYSGTIGAAIEGALHGIPSIGFSLCNHSAEADFSYALPYFEDIIRKSLENAMPENVCLNVNAPCGKIKGVKACRQASGMWANDFTKAFAPRQTDYYWLIGDFSYSDIPGDINADQCAIDSGYISIVPIKPDMTSYQSIDYCKMYETET